MEAIPRVNKNQIARNIMSKDVVSLDTVSTMNNIATALESGHHAFPILNKNKTLVGLIPRNFVITILKHKGFYNIDEDFEPEETPVVKYYKQQNAKGFHHHAASINTDLASNPLQRLKT